MIRSTRVTSLYQDGMELELVFMMFWRSSTEPTRIYVVSSVEMMQKVMEHSTITVDETQL